MTIAELRQEINARNPDISFFSMKGIILDALDDIETDLGAVTLSELPTSDPAVAGQIWNDGGVPTVSAG